MEPITDPIVIEKKRQWYRRKRLAITALLNIPRRMKTRWNSIIYKERTAQHEEYNTWFDTVNTTKSKTWISCYNCHKRTKDRNMFGGMFLCTPCLSKLTANTPNIKGFMHRGRLYHKKPNRRTIAERFRAVQNELQEA